MAEESERNPRRLLAEPRTRLTIEFLLLLVGAEVMRYIAYPARLAGLGFAAAAFVWGIRAYFAHRPLRRGPGTAERTQPAGTGASAVFVAIGVGLAGLLFVWHVVLATPLVVEFDRCRDQALTREAEQQCQREFEERLQEWGAP